MIAVHESLDSWTATRDRLLHTEKTIGFVPTMGALHEGHLSLLRRAREENDTVLLSIFLNPTQFNSAEDLKNYPSTLDSDVRLAAAEHCDHVITPTTGMMYPDDFRFRVSESELSKTLCGAHRPGHFDGVLSVVLKLFNIAKATNVYFGEKDFQQLELIRQMAHAFFLGVNVVGCPTVREYDGLAMSSRNVNLSAIERKLAPKLVEVLRTSLSKGSAPEVARSRLEELGFRVDYVQDERLGSPPAKRRFAAVFLGSVRLIDNVAEGAE